MAAGARLPPSDTDCAHPPTTASATAAAAADARDATASVDAAATKVATATPSVTASAAAVIPLRAYFSADRARYGTPAVVVATAAAGIDGPPPHPAIAPTTPTPTAATATAADAATDAATADLTAAAHIIHVSPATVAAANVAGVLPPTKLLWVRGSALMAAASAAVAPAAAASTLATATTNADAGADADAATAGADNPPGSPPPPPVPPPPLAEVYNVVSGRFEALTPDTVVVAPRPPGAPIDVRLVRGDWAVVHSAIRGATDTLPLPPSSPTRLPSSATTAMPPGEGGDANRSALHVGSARRYRSRRDRPAAGQDEGRGDGGISHAGGTAIAAGATPPPPPPPSWFAIGILRGVVEANHGTLHRTAASLGAAYTFTIGARYTKRIEGRAHTLAGHLPLLCFDSISAFAAAAPHGAPWVAVEMGGLPLETFVHPPRAVYVLGSEAGDGLPPAFVRRCRYHVALPAVGPAGPAVASYNVAAASAIVMWDRHVKGVGGLRFGGGNRRAGSDAQLVDMAGHKEGEERWHDAAGAVDAADAADTPDGVDGDDGDDLADGADGRDGVDGVDAADTAHGDRGGNGQARVPVGDGP
ncbi:hypothetical protein MMPV_001035 [Pyropia vietnamensis]